MFLAILGFLDVLVGISLIYPNFLAFTLGVLVLLKGTFSVIGSFASGSFFDFMGFIDLIAGIMLIFGFFIPWFWILPMIKGAYSIVVGLVSR
ncbi:MAG: hypothetical protein GTN36_04555 [Candidatus Aenigmarchaeota archaeon]|nr:hypothetical protein [Candidatus Aenigmarchaeota archaeon]